MANLYYFSFIPNTGDRVGLIEIRVTGYHSTGVLALDKGLFCLTTDCQDSHNFGADNFFPEENTDQFGALVLHKSPHLLLLTG